MTDDDQPEETALERVARRVHGLGDIGGTAAHGIGLGVLGAAGRAALAAAIAEQEEARRHSVTIMASNRGEVALVVDGETVATSDPVEIGKWYHVEWTMATLDVEPISWYGVDRWSRPKRTLHAEVYPRGLAQARQARMRQAMRRVERRAARKRRRHTTPITTTLYLSVDSRPGQPMYRVGTTPPPDRPGTLFPRIEPWQQRVLDYYQYGPMGTLDPDPKAFRLISGA